MTVERGGVRSIGILLPIWFEEEPSGALGRGRYHRAEALRARPVRENGGTAE